MSLPRLSGPRVALVPVPHALALAVMSGNGLQDRLQDLRLRAGSGWPHADTTDALRPLAEHGSEGDDGGWLVVVDGEVVGDCGWRGGPDAGGDVLLGYGLAVPARRQGIGTEVVAVLCAWADAQPGVRRLVADVHVDNEPSRRLLRRLGFAEEPDDPPWVRCVRGPGASPRIRGKHVC
ncbi:MAG: acetyltransferase, family [Frankiales bacterium]|nr:acetyltransferase, family [Frankiales bacterium]